MYEPGHSGPAPAPLDAQRLRDIFGDDRGAIAEVLAMAVDNVAQLARRLTLALSSGDRSEALSVAHEIKGVCGNIGADELAALAGRLHAMLQRGDAQEPLQTASLLEAYERFAASVKAALAG